MQKLAENVYGILTKFGYLNQYVIVNGDVITVVDMMLGKSDVDNLEKELKEQDWTLDDVQHLLITHAHPDHIGGLPEYRRRVDALLSRSELNGEMDPETSSG